VYIFLGVYCIPVACDAENRSSVAIDSLLDLVLISGNALLLMALVIFSAATLLNALFGGSYLAVSGSVRVISLT
jgi:hypothetical protein